MFSSSLELVLIAANAIVKKSGLPTICPLPTAVAVCYRDFMAVNPITDPRASPIEEIARLLVEHAEEDLATR
jgi:hypothetical protein